MAEKMPLFIPDCTTEQGALTLVCIDLYIVSSTWPRTGCMLTLYVSDGGKKINISNTQKSYLPFLYPYLQLIFSANRGVAAFSVDHIMLKNKECWLII